MQERINPLKSILTEGKLAVGIWCSLANAMTTEVVAGAGMDWLLIDGEHSPNDLSSIIAQLRVVGAYPAVEAMVRLPSDEPNLIKQMMDSGARSLMIPNVKTAEQARAIVASMSYAPDGIRGFSVSHRANCFGRIKNYHATARQQQFLAVQIECETGVANAAEIAAVPGVDALFVGPGDLSTNMGAMGQPNAEHVQTAIAKVLKDAQASRTPAGILAPVHADADRYIQNGFTMVAVGADLGLLARGADALIERFRAS